MSLDDERVRFYLRHMEAIERWAEIRGEVVGAFHEWMVGLGPHVERLVAELGPRVVLRAVTEPEENWPRFELSHAEWQIEGTPSPVWVGLEWLRKKSLPRGGETPYVGLRGERSNPLGDALRASDDVARLRVSLKHKPSMWWIGFKYVSATAAFPDSADEYRDQLLGALRETWLSYAPLVDMARANLGP